MTGHRVARRTLLIGSSRKRSSLGLLAASFLVLGAQALAATAEEEFVTGSGRADARVMRVGPSAGRLGLAPSVALALADFLGTQGRGESRAFEWAALDGSVPEDFKTRFPSLKVTNTEKDSEKGKSANPRPFYLQASATDDPSGRAVAVLDAVEVPGALRISGGRAESFAALLGPADKKVREAGGKVDIGRLELGPGTVILNDLHWELLQRTDRNDDTSPEVVGSFRVGSAVISGSAQNGPITGSELATLFGPINQALTAAGTGLVVDPPKLENLRGAGRMTPLGIRVVDSTIGKQVVAPVVSAAQPVREPVTNEIINRCKDCSPAVLLADVAIGVITGAGRLDIEVGGVFGYTEGETFDDPFANVPDLTDGDVGSIDSVSDVSIGQFDNGGGPALESSAGPIDGDVPEVALPPIQKAATRVEQSMRSMMWALLFLVASLVAAVAYTQYRRIRNARRALAI